MTGGLGCSGPLSSQALSIFKDRDPNTSLCPVPGWQHSHKEEFLPHGQQVFSLLQFVTISSLSIAAMPVR